MTDLAEILDGFEKALELERELGTRTVECDRALLAPLAARPVPVPSAQAVPAPRPTRPSSSSAPIASAGKRTRIFFVADSASVYVGASGELFGKMLTAMNLTRQDVALGSVDAGRDSLVDWIRRARPACIVVFGQNATRAFFPNRRFTRGMRTDFEGASVFITYSPARLVTLERSGSETTIPAKRETWETLKRALAVSAGA